MADYNPQEFSLKNGNKLVIRHCSESDAKGFASFQKQIANETQNTLQVCGEKIPVEKVAIAWKNSHIEKRHLVLGVFDNERRNPLVGQLIFKPINDKHPWIKHIGGFGMMILKEYWGQGLGQKLLNIMEGFAFENDFKRIEAYVRVNNERGIHLYKNAGFNIEGTRKAAAFIDGNFIDEYFIAKLLTNKIDNAQ